MVQRAFKRFVADESGAVTVDWVVLTAAIVALAFGVFTIVTQQSVTVGAGHMNDKMEEAANYSPTWAPTSSGTSGG
jgi:Flp pilus assembly pilin Flp